MQNYLPEELKKFKSISNEYDVYFIDLWGVIHNGLHLFENALIVLNELKKKDFLSLQINKCSMKYLN